MVGEDWERTPDERKMCQALEEVAKQVGAQSIQAGTSLSHRTAPVSTMQHPV